MRLVYSILAFTMLCGLFYAQPAQAEEACFRVAKINYHQIEDLLREVILSDPARSDLKKKYQVFKDEQKAQQEIMMKQALEAQKTGEMNINLNELQSRSASYQVDSEVRKLAKKEFSRMVEETYGKNYDLVIDGGWGKEVLYSKIPIPDVTAQFRQYLLKKKEASILLSPNT